jgi:hypothetical protein
VRIIEENIAKIKAGIDLIAQVIFLRFGVGKIEDEFDVDFLYRPIVI